MGSLGLVGPELKKLNEYMQYFTVKEAAQMLKMHHEVRRAIVEHRLGAFRW